MKIDTFFLFFTQLSNELILKLDLLRFTLIISKMVIVIARILIVLIIKTEIFCHVETCFSSSLFLGGCLFVSLSRLEWNVHLALKTTQRIYKPTKGCQNKSPQVSQSTDFSSFLNN